MGAYISLKEQCINIKVGNVFLDTKKEKRERPGPDLGF